MFHTAARRWMLGASLAVLSVAVPSTACVSSADPPNPAPAASAYAVHLGIVGPTSPFHDSVAARYNYAFGKDTPFLPSNATSSTGQFLNPKSFFTAQYCGHCHKEAYHQWRQSAHSNSFRAPWYLKNVNLLIAEKGVQYSRHCEGCHNPVALLSGDLSQGMPKKTPLRGGRAHLLHLPLDSVHGYHRNGQLCNGHAGGAGR